MRGRPAFMPAANRNEIGVHAATCIRRTFAKEAFKKKTFKT